MGTLRRIHQYMKNGERIVLADGRTGRIVRVDTAFPSGRATVEVWLSGAAGPGVARVAPDHVVGRQSRAVC